MFTFNSLCTADLALVSAAAGYWARPVPAVTETATELVIASWVVDPDLLLMLAVKAQLERKSIRIAGATPAAKPVTKPPPPAATSSIRDTIASLL